MILYSFYFIDINLKKEKKNLYIMYCIVNKLE